jgi:GNAT superfamily N-acetyltransferase
MISYLGGIVKREGTIVYNHSHISKVYYPLIGEKGAYDVSGSNNDHTWQRRRSDRVDAKHGKVAGRHRQAPVVSRRMIDYAAQECARRGIGWLRLDTDSERPKLCSLYEGFGFAEVERKTVGRFHVVLYELPIGYIKNGPPLI